MNCAECSHYHDLGDKLMCDAGLIEVTMVGNPQVVVKMQQCEDFLKSPFWTVDIKHIGEKLDKLESKLDKRTKEYKEKHK